MTTFRFLLIFILGSVTLHLSSSTALAQRNLKPEDLEASRVKADDEKCSDAIVGQFYFKICKKVPTTIETTEAYWDTERCVVYDKEKCCNVIVTRKVKKTRKVIKTELVEKEITFCKQFAVSLSQLEALQDCPCSDDEFLGSLKPTNRDEHNPIASESSRTQPSLTSSGPIAAGAEKSADPGDDRLVPVRWNRTERRSTPSAATKRTDRTQPAKKLTQPRQATVPSGRRISPYPLSMSSLPDAHINQPKAVPHASRSVLAARQPITQIHYASH